MGALVIRGREIADLVILEVKRGAEVLLEAHGCVPGLAVVIVGDDPASNVYVRSKTKMAAECGFRSFQHMLPPEASQQELEALIETLNLDHSVHGILVQLPIPSNLESERVIQSISHTKDVDGLHVVNVGKLGHRTL